MPGITRAKLKNRSGPIPLSRRSYCQPKLSETADPNLTPWHKMPGKPVVAFIVPQEQTLSKRTEKVRYLLSIMQLQYLTPLDAPIMDYKSRYERIPNTNIPNPEKVAVKRVTLLGLLQTLPPHQRRVLELLNGMAPDYPGYKMNYVEAGRVMGVSRQRVEQILKAALKILRKKISNSVKLFPYREWLNDQNTLSLMLEVLSSEEQQLFKITYKRWVSKARAAKLLNKTEGEIIKLRNKLKRKLDQLYKTIQDIGLQNIKTSEQLRELYEQSKFVRKAKQIAPKKPIERSLPVEEKRKLLDQGYKALADRDLGQNPITISELAAAISYSKSTVFKWIIESPEIVAPNMVLLLNRSFLRGSQQRTLALEHKRRRVRWALEFARANGLKYSSLDEFCEARLGFSCRFANSIKRWMFTDPELIKIFEEYQEAITKPDRSAVSAWAPHPPTLNSNPPHLPSDAGAFAHKHSAG